MWRRHYSAERPTEEDEVFDALQPGVVDEQDRALALLATKVSAYCLRSGVARPFSCVLHHKTSPRRLQPTSMRDVAVITSFITTFLVGTGEQNMYVRTWGKFLATSRM